MKKPNIASEFLCPHCHQPGPWADHAQVEQWQQERAAKEQAERERQAARARYWQVLTRAESGDRGALTEATALAQSSGYTAEELVGLHYQAFQRYAEQSLADDIVTKEEDEYFQALVPALGLSWETLNSWNRSLLDRLVIAEANGGMLPTLDQSKAILKKGEAAHWQCTAALMKDVALREFRGGYQGFSFPVGKKGVRYRVGAGRGHIQVVGHQLQVIDQGTLVVTSARCLYMGASKTQEFLYTKLVGLDVFTDGVRLHVSNRQTASLFQVPNGEVIAALVHAAMNRAALASS